MATIALQAPRSLDIVRIVFPVVSPFFQFESVFHELTGTHWYAVGYDPANGMVALTDGEGTGEINYSNGFWYDNGGIIVGSPTHKVFYKELQHCYEEL